MLPSLKSLSAPIPLQGQSCLSCPVRPMTVFGTLREATLRAMQHRVEDVRLDPGQPLFEAQTLGTGLFSIRCGVVRLEKFSERGERTILRLAGRGDMLGLEALLSQTYATTAIACTPVQACRIPRLQFEDLARIQPELSLSLMKRWQRALDDADEWLTELTRGPVRLRMLRLLLKLSEFSEEPSGLIWLPSRQEMGAMLDMTFETASRLVSAARRSGLLTPVGSRHARIDMDALLRTLRDGELDAA